MKKDLILKSLVDRCAEVLIQNVKYVDVSKLPYELTQKLLNKSCSLYFNPSDPFHPTYTYSIKAPERYTSFSCYLKYIKTYLRRIENVYVKKQKIAVLYELLDFLVQEKQLFHIMIDKTHGRTEIELKQKLISFWHKYHLTRLKEYWDLFDEPFPNKKTQKYYILEGKSVEELSHDELRAFVFLLTDDYTRKFPSRKELQDRLREALTVFDE